MTALGTAHATTEDFLNRESRNRGNGISEVEGKAARVAASELGDERVSNQEMEPAFKSGKQEIRKWDQRASCSPAFLIRKSPLSRRVRDREAAIISTRAACAPQATEFLIRKCGHRERGLSAYVETRSAPASLGATHRAFTFYLGNPFPRFLRSCFPY
jgi:hypothetical protein